jgi:soluble lytic murein transglycosylase
MVLTLSSLSCGILGPRSVPGTFAAVALPAPVVEVAMPPALPDTPALPDAAAPTPPAEPVAVLPTEPIPEPAPAPKLAPSPSRKVANAPKARGPDPVVEAVREHLLRYRHRTGLTEREIEHLARCVVTEARRHDFDPGLVLAVMHVESRYDAFAVSNKDAMGLMQILPSTGEWMAGKVGVRWDGPQTLFDPIANTRLGVAYLAELADRYGSLQTALSAYNWGPGRIDERLRRGTPLPHVYARLVFEAYGRTANRS